MPAKKLSSRKLLLHVQLKMEKSSLKSITDPRPRADVAAVVDVAAEAAEVVLLKVKFVLKERAAAEVVVNAVVAVVTVNAVEAAVPVNAVEAAVTVNAVEAVVMVNAVEAVVMVNAVEAVVTVKVVVADVPELP